MMETMTVFEDVFVPWERVFLPASASSPGRWPSPSSSIHRFTAISYKLPLVDALVGSALLLAELNGIARAGHVRDKLAWLIAYAETLRALTEHGRPALPGSHAPGIVVPDPLTVNMAKLHFATNYHEAVAARAGHRRRPAGHRPGGEDCDNPELGALPASATSGASWASTARRACGRSTWSSDLTASDFGGYQEVLAVHAEGSIEAEKLTILRNYDARRGMAYARRLAGIDPPEGPPQG